MFFIILLLMCLHPLLPSVTRLYQGVVDWLLAVRRRQWSRRRQYSLPTGRLLACSWGYPGTAGGTLLEPKAAMFGSLPTATCCKPTTNPRITDEHADKPVDERVEAQVNNQVVAVHSG